VYHCKNMCIYISVWKTCIEDFIPSYTHALLWSLQICNIIEWNEYWLYDSFKTKNIILYTDREYKCRYQI
jgi:hypothetical protein